MFGKNNVQRNFKKQMKEIEKELKAKEKEEAGAFTNPFYKYRFYGYTSSSAKGIFGKVLDFIFSPIVITIILFIVLGLFASSGSDRSDMISAYENGKYAESIDYCDKILSKNRSDFDALVYKGYSLSYLGNYKDALEYLKRAEKVNSDDKELYMEIGYNHYELSEYEEALKYFDMAIEMDNKYSDAYMWKGFALNELLQYDELSKCVNILLSIDKNNAYAYNLRGLCLADRGKYEDAIEDFRKAIELYEDEDEKYEVAYTNIAWAMYYQKNYSECINYCKSIKEYFPENYDIPVYMGDCYSVMGEYENAISCYEEANKLNPDDSSILSSIGWEYFTLEEYEKASQYVSKALALDSNDYSATTLNESLEEAKKPEGERIVNFVKQNYLYFDKVKDFDRKAKNFMEKNEISLRDIYDFIESIRLKDDPFTFFVFDEYYDEMMEEDKNSQIEQKTLADNIQYIKIKSFTTPVAEEFKSAVKSISKANEQLLVIDLRDNPGGMAFSANDILDFLLPECVTSYMVDRDGEISSYESDEDQVSFKHIYIFVNGESASSSELLTLGLKTYLNNVTIIGKPTFGKGVGQTTFESRKKKYMIFLVNCYWNIKEKNLTDKKIQPDILVKGRDLSDYINKMNDHIAKR